MVNPIISEKTHELDKEYSPILAELLSKRGISTKNEAKDFINPDYERDVHDPYLLSSMVDAVDRVKKAITENELIAIYSDYDMDGIPGAVVLHDFFDRIEYKNTTHYIPNRNVEGFGLHKAAIDKLSDSGAKLIITIDCGIRAVEQVAHARSLGIDVIVTDHHVPGDVLPDATVIINPMKEDDGYPNKNICGAGVIFKFVQALLRDPQFSSLVPLDWEKWLLDMVAAATISDMVSLTGENRALAYFGLMVMRKSTRPGLKALCVKTRLKQPYITETDIAFSIAPRINAASRMGEADSAFKLLTASTYEEAGEYANVLESLNKKRKGAAASMVRQINKKLSDKDELPNVIIIGDPRWQPGLLGLAAHRTVELYKRPVCVWGRGGAGEVKGSCRSDGNVDIVDLLSNASDILTEYGGHIYSGGFGVKTQDVHKLVDVLSNYKVKENGKKKEELSYDLKLSIESATWDTYHDISQLAPFGIGNPRQQF